MPKLEYFLVAESVSVDRDTNRVSLFNIVEEVSGSLPARIPALVVVSSWNVLPEDRKREFQVTLRISLPGGVELPKSEDFAVNFTAQRSRQRILQFVKELPLEQPGDLKLEVLLNGKHAASHTVTVHTIPTQNGNA